MSWHTNHIGTDTVIIMDEDRVVGSMKTDGPHWHVEILWSGNDITYQAADYIQALAFVSGAEAVFQRIEAYGG